MQSYLLFVFLKNYVGFAKFDSKCKVNPPRAFRVGFTYLFKRNCLFDCFNVFYGVSAEILPIWRKTHNNQPNKQCRLYE